MLGVGLLCVWDSAVRRPHGSRVPVGKTGESVDAVSGLLMFRARLGAIALSLYGCLCLLDFSRAQV